VDNAFKLKVGPDLFWLLYFVALLRL